VAAAEITVAAVAVVRAGSIYFALLIT
jgi:hypothetical protein